MWQFCSAYSGMCEHTVLVNHTHAHTVYNTYGGKHVTINWNSLTFFNVLYVLLIFKVSAERTLMIVDDVTKLHVCICIPLYSG